MIGVAGNFAGHLEQAGEAAEFAHIPGAKVPKGIFPVYVPGRDDFLGVFPMTSGAITVPASESPLNLQIEPEVGLLCDLEYDHGVPAALEPVAIGAFNDCSIRRDGAAKISEKKNWGPNSEGFASLLFEVDEIDADGATENFRLTCFLRRSGSVHPYGIDSPLPGYSYYGSQLLDWIVERLQNQEGPDGTTLEPVGEYLAACGNPARMLIGIGATRYSDFGETNFLTAGDESIVVVYDGAVHSATDVEAAVAVGGEAGLESASVLVQRVS